MLRNKWVGIGIAYEVIPLRGEHIHINNYIIYIFYEKHDVKHGLDMTLAIANPVMDYIWKMKMWNKKPYTIWSSCFVSGRNLRITIPTTLPINPNIPFNESKTAPLSVVKPFARFILSRFHNGLYLLSQINWLIAF